MTKIVICYLSLAIIAASCSTSAQPAARGDEYSPRRTAYNRLHYEANDESSNDINNDLVPNRDGSSIVVLPSTVLERESSSNEMPVEKRETLPKLPAIEEEKHSLNNPDKVKSIAFNSREIRLTGPDGREVEMKDDMATKMVIALENLQKEASEVWGKVNSGLDKGWDEFKTMIEEVVSPKNKRNASNGNGSNGSQSRYVRDAPKSSLVEVSDVDGYSMADDSTVSQKLETAGSKVKGFFTDTLGFNEENQKKAGDALSKAGASVGETVTKDIPDALKKASSVVGETVTKDIPDAFKSFFG